MLKIAVCIKITIDTNQLSINEKTREPRLEKAPLRINPFDENALEEAVKIKEKQGAQVLAVSLVSEEPPRELILKALAMGADEFYVIEDKTSGKTDPLASATILSVALKQLEPLDLIICGEGSADLYNKQVGPRIGEELHIPSITYAIKYELQEGTLLVHRGLENRVEVVKATLPALLTVGQEINDPRLPAVLAIFAASGKPVHHWNLAHLDIPDGQSSEMMAGTTHLSLKAPVLKRKQHYIDTNKTTDGVEELVELLFKEGVVGA